MDQTSERLVIDTRGWPLLFVRFPVRVTADTMRAFVDAIERAYGRAQRFVAVVDLTAVTNLPDGPARAVLTTWTANEQRVERERALTVGTAIVMSSGPIRALMAAMSVMKRRVSPQQVVATLPEAMYWARERLREAQLTFSAEASTACAEIIAASLRLK